jgi:hypothetical protein
MSIWLRKDTAITTESVFRSFIGIENLMIVSYRPGWRYFDSKIPVLCKRRFAVVDPLLRKGESLVFSFFAGGKIIFNDWVAK